MDTVYRFGRPSRRYTVAYLCEETWVRPWKSLSIHVHYEAASPRITPRQLGYQARQPQGRQGVRMVSVDLPLGENHSLLRL
jgi:hypothetical protein